MSEQASTWDPVSAQGNYRPVVVHGGVARSAGMTPRVGGELLVRGCVGADLEIEDARRAAGMAASNALRAIAHEAGGLDEIAQCLRMTVFVACVVDFTEHSRVADGASDAMSAWLGERGIGVRSAVGVRCLPSGAPVEVELSAALR